MVRLTRILVVVWVLSVCKSSRADDDQHGRVDSAKQQDMREGNPLWADESVHLFSYELMLAEAEEVAHRAGAAFAGLSYDDVSQDNELLACIGDPDFTDEYVCEKNEYDQCKASADEPWYESERERERSHLADKVRKGRQADRQTDSPRERERERERERDKRRSRLHSMTSMRVAMRPYTSSLRPHTLEA
jgi:hypothetical protein